MLQILRPEHSTQLLHRAHSCSDLKSDYHLSFFLWKTN